MSPALTRRGLVQAGAAALGVSVAGVAAMARAGVADPDAALFDMIARHAAIVAERDSFQDRLEALEARFKADMPSRPPALEETWPDRLRGVMGNGQVRSPNGRLQTVFTACDVERLRDRPAMRFVEHRRPAEWNPEDTIVRRERVPDEPGEARRQEILAAWDAWQAEKGALANRIGLTEAMAEDGRLYDLTWSCRDAVREMVPVTLAGLCAKARWVCSLDDGGEEASRVTRDLAAFGQAT